MTIYKGQCLCGDIQYQVSKIEQKIGHCHCKMCRKFHGAAFATFGEAKSENFKWIKGEDLLQSYQAENGSTRQFCQKCGSSMIFIPSNDDGKLVEFTLGTLDSDLDLQPDVHIFIASKANWSIVSDSLPQYEGDRSTKRVD
jgi:hypothetical protein